jgi:phosphatidylserine synthase
MLGCGLASLAATQAGNQAWSLRCILAAGIFDGLAGAAATGLDRRSSFGREVDSLSCLASLGIAPLAFIHQSSLSRLGPAGLWICGLAAVLASLGLSRPEGKLPGEQDHRGLPLSAVGILLALAAYLGLAPFALTCLMAVLAVLMLLPWGYARIPARLPILGIFFGLALAALWLERPSLLEGLAFALGAYALAGHLPWFKKRSWMRPRASGGSLKVRHA